MEKLTTLNQDDTIQPLEKLMEIPHIRQALLAAFHVLERGYLEAKRLEDETTNSSLIRENITRCK